MDVEKRKSSNWIEHMLRSNALRTLRLRLVSRIVTEKTAEPRQKKFMTYPQYLEPYKEMKA